MWVIERLMNKKINAILGHLSLHKQHQNFAWRLKIPRKNYASGVINFQKSIFYYKLICIQTITIIAKNECKIIF